MLIGAFCRTLLSRFFLLVLMIIFFIPTVIFISLPEKIRYQSRFIFRLIDWFYRAVLAGSLVPIRYTGVEHIPDEPVIFVANHQSSLDIPLVGALAHGTPHIWLAKEELMASPILRWILPRFAVLVNQSSPRKAVRSLLHVLDLIKGNERHMMIFPEGGRFTDGKIHAFFRGFVILAKKTGRPVIPVCIKGVNKVYPPTSFLIHSYPIEVIIGPAFKYKQDDTDNAFKQRIYQWFVATME